MHGLPREVTDRGREGHDRTMNTSNGTRRLYRKPEGQIVAGVCTGLADYLGIDVTIVRLVFAALAVFGGAGVLLYVIAWAVVPEEGEKSSIVEGLREQEPGRLAPMARHEDSSERARSPAIISARRPVHPSASSVADVRPSIPDKATTSCGPMACAAAPPIRMPRPWAANSPDWARPKARARPEPGRLCTNAAAAVIWKAPPMPDSSHAASTAQAAGAPR